MGLPNVLNDDCDATRFPQRLPKHTKVSAFAQKMTFNNSSDCGGIVDSAPEEKHILLASGCIAALIIGTYISWNALWHLKVKFFHCKENINEISVFPKVI